MRATQSQTHATDALTGLLQAHSFISEVDRQLASDSVTSHCALISCDLESFRLYNTAYGYRRGDALLRMLARLLELSFPDSLIARMADDCFAVLIQTPESECAAESECERQPESECECAAESECECALQPESMPEPACERQLKSACECAPQPEPTPKPACEYAPDPDPGLECRLQRISEHIQRATAETPIQLKAGIYHPEQGDTALSAHDKACLARKSIKKDTNKTFAYFDSERWARLNRKHYILNRIDDAIAHGCIRVFYQPIVNVTTGKVCAFEALARWDDPVLGFLSPAEFIETLEQAHLIHKLDLEIVRQACRDLRGQLACTWPDVAVSVNLSRADFDACDIAGEVERIVNTYGIDRSLLHLEITESALVDSECALNEGIFQLQDEGYSLFMDDFGSGYSTLNVLKDYDFDTLKIDLRFLSCGKSTATKETETCGKSTATKETDSYGEDKRLLKARAIIESVVGMAKSIGMHALAEGVETHEQLAFLTDIGCEMVQGYLFGRPQPLELLRCVA